MSAPRPAAPLAGAALEQLAREVATGQQEGPLNLPAYEPTPWARELLAAARAVGPVPDYGTPAWDALPAADPRRMAAAVVAAELQRYEEATLADRLRLEVRALRAQHLAEEEAGYAELAELLPSSVTAPPPAPFAEPVPVRQTADWPVVRQPGGQRRAVLPSTAEMIRRVS